MSNLHFNRLAQFILLILSVCIFSIWVLASRPPARPFGRYNGKLDIAQPVYGIVGETIAYITVSSPAVVTLPTEWNIPDLVCMVVTIERNNTGSSPDTQEINDQSEWDKNYRDWMIFDNEAVRSTSSDGTRLKLAAPLLTDFILLHTHLTLKLYGLEPIILEKNQKSISLLCYYHYFFQNEADVPHLPFYHETALRARNVAVYSYPAYHFRYNSLIDPSDADGTVTLQKVTLQDYLQKLLIQSPLVVQTITPLQRNQLETETASSSQ